MGDRMGDLSVKTPIELSDMVDRMTESRFSISLIETEPEAQLGNPKFNYSLLIKGANGNTINYELINDVEKSRDHDMFNGGAMMRRVNNIKRILSKEAECELEYLFFDKDYKMTPKYSNYELRLKEGFTLSYSSQVMIASGIIHIASLIEPTIMRRTESRGVVEKLGEIKVTKEMKNVLYEEAHPLQFYIPQKVNKDLNFTTFK